MKLKLCDDCSQHYDAAACVCPHCGRCVKTAGPVKTALVAAGMLAANWGCGAVPLYGSPIMLDGGAKDAGTDGGTDGG